MRQRLALVFVCFTLGCKTPGPVAPVAIAPLKVTFVGTNDVHGWVMTQVERFPKGDIRYGGAAAFAGYLKILREDNPDGVVLVDAGDMFQGTLLSNVTEGSSVIEAFNLLGYDAAAIGNHEFDYGPVGPASAATSSTLDPFGALKARIEQARFPLLSMNTFEAASGRRPSWLPFDGTVIIERHGLKIGIMGLTTPQTPTTTLPVNVSSLKFTQLAPEALTGAQSLRARGADLVIAVVHAGGKCTDCEHPNDLTSCDIDSAEIFTMVKTLPAGTLDAVVAGHTHTQLNHLVNGTPIMQSWALGRFFGVIELYVDPLTKRVLPEKMTMASAVPICEAVDATTQGCDVKSLRSQPERVSPQPALFRGRKVVPEPNIIEVLARAESRVAEQQNAPLGLEVPKMLGRNYESESGLGSFLADSLRAMEKADVALLNPGGLRADLKGGPLRYGAVYEVLPFDNTVATVSVTGDELLRLLSAAYGSKKGVFQLSGIEVRLARCPSPNRLQSATLPGGKPLVADRRYRVVMPDFLARGGDGLGPMLATLDPSNVDFGDGRGVNLRDELVSFWKKTKAPFLAPTAGRVVFSDDGASCTAAAKMDQQTRIP
jgi:5'-nucleotidase